MSARLQLFAALLCVFLVAVRAEFDDIRSRRLFFPLAAVAYNDEPLLCLKNRLGENVELIGRYTGICDPADKCFAFLAISHDSRAILLGFRGSMTILQLLSEGIDTMLRPHVRAWNGTLVSAYFYNSFNSTWNAGLERDLHTLMIDDRYRQYEVRVAGHSLGAAMAAVTATQIALKYEADRDRLHLYTYGEPRVGDLAFSKLHNRIVSNSYRITHKKDMIPNIPPLNLWFHHHFTEVYFPGDMSPGASYKICKYAEDFSCGDGSFGWSIADHLNFYTVRPSVYGLANCIDDL